jgi:hypothetical protein
VSLKVGISMGWGPWGIQRRSRIRDGTGMGTGSHRDVVYATRSVIYHVLCNCLDVIDRQIYH